MTAAVVVFFVLLALGLALALADRMGSTLAERKASEYLSAPLGQAASVRVHGTPFLTQALRGRYGDVEVSGGGVQVGEMSGGTLDAHLYNVLLPLRDLLGRQAQELPCERVEGQIVLPYGELARVSRVPGLSLDYEKDHLVASASLPVPGINQLARVSGRAALTVVDGAVWLRVRGLSVAGISLPSLVVKQLLPSLNVPIPLPQLPYGLRLDSLTPGRTGLIVTGSAQDVVFKRLTRGGER